MDYIITDGNVVIEGIDGECSDAEKLKTIRLSTGMNKREFSEWLEIPYRTYQDWELGKPVQPYILKLIAYRVLYEKRKNEK